MGASVTGLPVWVSLSVNDSDGTKLRSGELLVDAIPMLKEFNPAVVLINCSMKANISRKMWEDVNSFVLQGREAMQYPRFTWEI